MTEKSSRNTGNSSAEKKSSSTRKTTAKKRSPARKRPKAKKPKVTLARNKVALFCALVSGICVLSLALSIVLNSGTFSQKSEEKQVVAKITPNQEKTAAQKTETPARTEKAAQNQPIEKKEIAPQAPKAVPEQKKIESKKESSKPVEKPLAQKAESVPKVQAQKSAPAVQSQSVPSQKTEAPKKETAKTQPQKTSTQNASAQKNASQTTATKNTAQSVSTNATAQKSNSALSGANPQKITKTQSPQNQSLQNANSAPQAQIASGKKDAGEKPTSRFDIPPASNGATIVIIIDDAGRSAENTKKYTSLPFPITIAVLPKLPESRKCADVIRAARKEVILHQPMQSMNLNLDPGPGKITENMSSYEIAAVIKENLSELGPGVRGMNNHEGSLITSNVIKIGTVLDVCDEMGVYFLDSRTTAQTKAPQAALERDMHIFEKAGPYLDNEIDRAKMLERMRETLAYANRHGRAIVIGHVDKSVKILPDLLREMYPEMKAAGYRFATPSMLR